MSDHLEVIGPSGEILFFPLDAVRGITTIGRAPANDLRLDGPQVPDYAATLDHRQPPYSLTATGDGSAIRINGQNVPALQPHTLAEWDSVEVDGYVLILAGSGAAAGAPSPPPAARAAEQNGLGSKQAAVAPLPAALPAGGSAGNGAEAAALATGALAPAAAAPLLPAQAPAVVAPVPAGIVAPGELPVFGTEVRARPNDLIFTTVRQRVQTIDGGQVAVWEVDVTNASRYVAEFDITIEGPVPAQWVTIAPNNFNLAEREQKTVAITVAPPRHASTLAGRYNFAIVVASDEVRGLGGAGGPAVVDRTIEPVLLVVNPFFEFALDPAQPEVAQARYRERVAHFSVPIRNNGNSSVRYRVEAADTARACLFDYFAADGSHLETRTLLVGPLEPAPAPVVVQARPLKRRLIAAGPRTYDLTFTVTPVDGLTTPLSTRARLAHDALFGRWVIALLALLAAVAIILVFRPRINHVHLTFADLESGQQETIASRADRLESPDDGVIVQPGAENEGLGVAVESRLFGRARVAEAILPDAEVRVGESITLTWDTANGSTLVIYPEGQPDTVLTQVDDRAGVANGSFRLPLGVQLDDQGAPTGLVATDAQGRQVVLQNYQIAVRNWIASIPLLGVVGESSRTLRIGVLPANPPSVTAFAVSPASALTGQPIALDWSATLPNAGDRLFLQQRQNGVVVVEEPLAAPVGTLVLTPVADTEYRLVPQSNAWLGTAQPQATAQFVSVSTPVPTLVPTPSILRLDIQPLQIVAGNPITISYAISGGTSNQLRFIGLPTPMIELPAPVGELPVLVPSPGRFSVSILSARLPDGVTDPTDPRAGRAEALTTRVAQAPTATPSPTPTLSPTPTPQVPVIEVLSLSPDEIVRGATDEVLLTWNVIGDADQIEISAPDFEFTSTQKKDSISVPRDRGRVFVMTVFLAGEPLASGSVELKVLEPTPTLTATPPPTATPLPPPTATPLPPPRIVAFGAQAEGIRREVQNGLDVYFVDGGSEVVISWEVTDATQVDIDQNTPAGKIEFDKRLARDQITILATANSDFIMDAYNNPENLDVTNPDSRGRFGTTTRTIRVELNPAVVPDPPTNVTFTGGATPEDPVTINWEYNSNQVDRILGFRVYRAPAGSGDFVRVADETALTNSLRTWTDPSGPFCNRAYFVVAVYVDLTLPGADKTVETDSGDTSFLTPPCP